MFELKPMNKYIVIETIAEDTKVAGGLLYAPGNVSNQYRTAKVIAVSECDEAKGINVGDVVLYDTIGSVSHRVGNQSITTVKVMNVLGVVSSKEQV